jgi:tetratricopeptide (TPR) repeat protein
MLLAQNKVSEAAEAFKRAEKAAPSQAAVANNLGIIEARNGNSAVAMDYYRKAGGAQETKYNMAIIEVRQGKYTEAVSDFGSYNGHNKALAQLMSGNAGQAKETLESSNEKDMAHSLYLKAVASARMGNTADAMTNLKAAIEKDNSFKAYAKEDIEFLKMRADNGFTSLVK